LFRAEPLRGDGGLEPLFEPGTKNDDVGMRADGVADVDGKEIGKDNSLAPKARDELSMLARCISFCLHRVVVDLYDTNIHYSASFRHSVGECHGLAGETRGH
jgi:hypothetical protein